MKKRLMFGVLISLFMEPYMELLISAYLNIKAPVTTKNGDKIGVIIGYVAAFGACGILPFTYLWVISRSQETIQDSNFRQTWDCFYSETKGQRVSQMLFNFISLLRRFVFVVSVLNLDQSTF